MTVLITILACGKDTLETRPTIKLKNVNADEIGPNSILQLFVEYSDKEGDLGQGQVTYVRNRTNIKPIPNPGANDKVDTVRYQLPAFSDKTTGEIQVNIPYNFLDEDPDDNDSMILRIVVQDVQGNISDTIQTGRIVARQN